MIQREPSMSKLKGFQDKQIIKIITGMRRCGKSTLLKQFRDYLLSNGVRQQQIISVNFEDMNFDHLLDAKALHDYVCAQLVAGQKNYVFLDEIQLVPGFQRAVDSLFLRENIDIYLTGSNAMMLSGDLATLLAGRYVEIEMLPFSFKEYVEATGNHQDLERKYMAYLQSSSFPYVLEIAQRPDLIRDYLGGIFNTVVLKDIVARKKIADAMMLESLIKFIFNNIGNLCSTKKISDTMTSDGRKISTHTVESYLSGLQDSYIVYGANRYDIKGKQLLKTLGKYYVVDIGLRNYLLGDKGADVGHVLENVIYLELVRRGYNVYVGRLGELEVDFVAVGPEGNRYYQVAATVRDQATLERELRPLRKIDDHYPKFLITRDNDPTADFDGIKQINAIDFLLE